MSVTTISPRQLADFCFEDGGDDLVHLALPLIGQLFQSRDNNIQDTELLVFVTPSIIRDSAPGGGAVGGSEAGPGRPMP